MTSLVKRFPRNFAWGVATASYQIEGAVNEDGRGASIWDIFSHTPGKILHGDTGDIACDHYHRMREDVNLMSQLGISHYRFSISWPRIFPMGYGQKNSRGLDFYDQLTDQLLQENIEPLVTLYHWDLPQALQEKGGWINRDTAFYFRDYAAMMFDKLGDRVHNWITHNEPWVTTVAGHIQGHHAPGLKQPKVGRKVAHHLLLSHGLAVEAYRDMDKGRIGITLNLHPVYPASSREEDLTAQRLHDAFHNTWFLDPVFKGTYPDDLNEILPLHDEFIAEGDLNLIQQPLDFLGVNYYAPHRVRWNPDDISHASLVILPEEPITSMGWPVDAKGLTDLLIRIHQDYGPIPIVITENGAAYEDVVEDGKIHDALRQHYLEMHWNALANSIEQGVPVQGYYVWSFLDNFEWALGYSKRFGIVYVDYLTQQRIVKDSGLAYSRFLREFYEYHHV
ncbi:GH1 family beta-glucosidase [Sulfobacillus thermosulfidooxidans]|uniref:GH1 family beta-glucosidase n=1 Tax=Sulfobacillus thermosulfidooxidans TaxID=28034 RepID=UPI000304F4D0|nr:GH1 family beta-glucosidase [Sulfobacillus thermosulfidooxidans]